MFSHTLLFVIYFRTPNLYGYLMYISIWSITAYHAFPSLEGYLVHIQYDAFILIYVSIYNTYILIYISTYIYIYIYNTYMYTIYIYIYIYDNTYTYEYLYLVCVTLHCPPFFFVFYKTNEKCSIEVDYFEILE